MKRTPLRFFLLLSLVLHLFFGLFVWVFPHRPSNITQKSFSPVSIEMISSPRTNDKKIKLAEEKRQIVEQSERAFNDETPAEKFYLSRHNQSVVRETKAAVHGKFENKTATIIQNQKSRHESQELNATSSHSQNAENIRPKNVPSFKDLKLHGNEGFHWPRSPMVRAASQEASQRLHGRPPPGGADSTRIAATDDHLKDVKVGVETVLNTREFVYYAYYARIKEQLRHHWEPKIRDKILRLVVTGRTIASQDRTTRLTITLDAWGSLLRVQVVEGSGLSDLDDAAIEAFRSASPFPNPPKGIISSDGTVQIHWDFVLEA